MGPFRERGPRVTRGHVGRKSTHGTWVWHAAWTPRGTPGLKSTHFGTQIHAVHVDSNPRVESVPM